MKALGLSFGRKMQNSEIMVKQVLKQMEKRGFELATEGFVNAAHRHNLAVHYWTINEIDDMNHLISIGADGIMTDYPHRLKEVYDSYNK